MTPNSTTEKCGLCGRDPAAGFAMIGDTRFCHGDLDAEPTCYMQSQSLGMPSFAVEHVVRGEQLRGEWPF